MQKKKKNVVGENGITIRKSLCRKRGDYYYGQENFPVAYALRIYTNNDKHTF